MFDEEGSNFHEVEKISDVRYVSGVEYSYGNEFYSLKDTVWLRDNEIVSIRLPGEYLFGIDVKIDDQVITIEVDETGLFQIDSRDLDYGTHLLQITQHVKSGTKSMGDLVGGEYASYITYFVIQKDKQIYIPNFKVAFSDGSLEFSWNQYASGDFKKYVIEKTRYSDQTYYKELLNITNQNTTVAQDDTYLGGKYFYRFRLDRGGSFIDEVYYLNETWVDLNLELEKLNDNQVRVSWKPVFYNNIISSNITITDENLGEIFSQENIANQSFVEFNKTLKFSDVLTCNLWFNSADEPITQKVAMGKKIPFFSQIVYDEDKDNFFFSFVHHKIDYLGYGIMDGALNPIDTVLYSRYGYIYQNPIVQSPDGQISYLLKDSEFNRLDLNTLSLTPSLTINDDFSYNRNLSNFAVTNNNIFSYFSSRNDKFQIRDMPNGQVLYEEINPESLAHISADGEYFAMTNRIYKRTGGSYNLKMTLPYLNMIFLRFYENEEKLLIVNRYETGNTSHHEIVIYDYVNDQIVKRIDYDYLDLFGSHSRHNFNEKLGLYTVMTNDFKIVDLSTRDIQTIETGWLQEIDIIGDYVILRPKYSGKKAGFHAFASKLDEI